MHTKSQSNPFRVGSNPVIPHKSSDKKLQGPIVPHSRTMRRETTTRWMQHGRKFESGRLCPCSCFYICWRFCQLPWLLLFCCSSLLRQCSAVVNVVAVARTLQDVAPEPFFWMASIVPWVIGNDSFLVFFSKGGPHHLTLHCSSELRLNKKQKTTGTWLAVCQPIRKIAEDHWRLMLITLMLSLLHVAWVAWS